MFCFLLDSEKYGKKMIKFSSSFKLNKFHRVDSPFNEDPNNINLFQGGLKFGEGQPENLGKWAITGTSIVMQIGGCEFRKSVSAPTPWYQNPCDTSIFLHARPIFRKNEKEPKFDPF